MSFFNKAKQAAEQAAAKAKEGVEDVQQKRELNQAYNDLGKAAFHLIQAGEISHAKLEESAGQIRTLMEKIAEPSAAGATSSPDDGGDPSQPPAMPT